MKSFSTRERARRADVRKNARMLRVTVRFTEGGSDFVLAAPWTAYVDQLPRRFRRRVEQSLAEQYERNPLINDRWPWNDSPPPERQLLDRLAVKTAAWLLGTRGSRYVIRERNKP